MGRRRGATTATSALFAENKGTVANDENESVLLGEGRSKMGLSHVEFQIMQLPAAATIRRYGSTEGSNPSVWGTKDFG